MPDREDLIQQIHEHFKRISELLDHLDIVLPEHKSNLEKVKEDV